VEMMLKRALEDELLRLNIMISGETVPSHPIETLQVVKQYIEARLAALS
jgi:hypothetical protein